MFVASKTFELFNSILPIFFILFANFSSIGILLGGLGGIAPERKSEIAKLGLKAVFAGFLANLMSAAIAGFYLSF